MMTPKVRQTMTDWLDDFKYTIENASQRLLSISNQESSIPRAKDKWSPKEIIGHLIDSAANNHQRFVRAQFADDLIFQGYDQEQWVRAQAYIREPWVQLVELWRLYNLHLLHVISVIPVETLTKPRLRHNLQQIAGKPLTKRMLRRLNISCVITWLTCKII